MAFGLENIGGLGFLNDISFDKIFASISSIGQTLIYAFLIAVVIGGYLYSRKSKKSYDKKIHMFEEINGQFVPVGDDEAMEVTIPTTTVKVFYLKKLKIYLPRATIPMGKDRFWYGIRRNREWVNFRLKDLNKEMKEAGLDYDHTDMRYANTNLKKLLQENYNKKKWWEQHADKIAVGVLVLLIAFSFWFVLGRVEDLISLSGQILDRSSESCGVAMETLSKLDNVCAGSGISRV